MNDYTPAEINMTFYYMLNDPGATLTDRERAVLRFARDKAIERLEFEARLEAAWQKTLDRIHNGSYHDPLRDNGDINDHQ